jgi:hypothetical protein
LAGNGKPTFDVIFSPFARAFAPIALAASAVLPVEGLGIDVCFFHRILAVPCPACGLTRSFTNLTHGRFEQAVAWHPFGPVLYAMFVAATLYAILPAAARARIAAQAFDAEAGWKRGYRVFLVAFLGFGVVRAVAHQVTGTPF